MQMTKFARTAYSFWYFRGTKGAAINRLVSTANVLILWIAVLFFTYNFDWDSALNCEEQDCAKVPDLVHHPNSHVVSRSWKAQWAAFFFLGAMSAALLWEIYQLADTWYCMREFEAHFVEDPKLVVPLTDLGSVLGSYLPSRAGYEAIGQAESEFDSPIMLEDATWDFFVSRLCEKIRDGEFQGMGNPETYDELKFTQLLLLRENHRIYLASGARFGEERATFEEKFGSILDENVCEVFLKQVLTSDYNLSRSPSDICDHVRSRLIGALVLSAALWPFVTAFFLTKLIVKNLADLKSQPSTALTLNWTTDARWKLRLYNEVQHVLDSRLTEGREVANRIIRSREQPSAYLRVLQRLGATLVASILLISLLNGSILTYGVAGGRTLVWWLSIGFLLFSIGSTDRSVQREYDHAEDLAALVKCLHYERETWTRSASHLVRSLTSDLLARRLKTGLVDFVKILFIPVAMGYLLRNPDLILELVNELRQHASTIDNLGDCTENSVFSLPEDPALSPKTSKLLKSIASFTGVHSRWGQQQIAMAKVATLSLKLARGTGTAPPTLAALRDRYRDERSNGVRDVEKLLAIMCNTEGEKEEGIAVCELEEYDKACRGTFAGVEPLRLALFVNRILLQGSAAVEPEAAEEVPAAQDLYSSTLYASQMFTNQNRSAPSIRPQGVPPLRLATAHQRERAVLSALDAEIGRQLSSRRQHTPRNHPVNDGTTAVDVQPERPHHPPSLIEGSYGATDGLDGEMRKM